MPQTQTITWGEIIAAMTGISLVLRAAEPVFSWLEERVKAKLNGKPKPSDCNDSELKQLCKQVAELAKGLEAADDERKDISNSLNQIGKDAAQIKKVLIEGNGQEALVTRVARLEEKVKK